VPTLRIRGEQLKVFEEERIDAFVARAMGEVVQHWPLLLETLGEAALRERLRQGTRRAMDLGLETEGQLLRYLNVGFALGDDFTDTLPEARAILEGPLSPAEKLEGWVQLAARELRRRNA
jgi:hypothetical protein